MMSNICQMIYKFHKHQVNSSLISPHVLKVTYKKMNIWARIESKEKRTRSSIPTTINSFEMQATKSAVNFRLFAFPGDPQTPATTGLCPIR